MRADQAEFDAAVERMEAKRRQLPKSPGQAKIDAPGEPEGGWKECRTCKQRWTKLGAGGECIECAPPPPPARLPTTRDRALASAGVPLRFRETFVEPDPWPRATGADGTIEAWSGAPELLTLQGVTDTGKTMLAVELMWRQDGTGAWVTAGRVPDLLIRGNAEEWGRLTGCGTLLIDELGRGHNKDAWEYLYEVTAERWNWRRPTIFTTNLRAAEIEEAHPPLYRRIQEGWVVPLTRSWRTRTGGAA